MENVLLHCCCAPCSLSCIEPLRQEKLWRYNPQEVSFNFPAIFMENRAHKFADTMPGDED